MNPVLRAITGVLLLAAAILLVVLTTRWGTDLDTTALIVVPGSDPPMGLHIASWVGRPIFGMALGVALPLILASAAVWMLIRVPTDA
jgi:hypothetical protein